MIEHEEEQIFKEFFKEFNFDHYANNVILIPIAIYLISESIKDRHDEQMRGEYVPCGTW